MIKVERQSGFGKRETVRSLGHGQSGTFSLGKHYLELNLFKNDLLRIELLDKGPVVLRFPRYTSHKQECLDAEYTWTNTSAFEVVVGPRRLWPWTERLIVTNHPLAKF